MRRQTRRSAPSRVRPAMVVPLHRAHPRPVRDRPSARRSGCRQPKPRHAVWLWPPPVHAKPRTASVLLLRKPAASRKMRAAVRCARRPNANARSKPIRSLKRLLPKKHLPHLRQSPKRLRLCRLQAVTLRLPLPLQVLKLRLPCPRCRSTGRAATCCWSFECPRCRRPSRPAAAPTPRGTPQQRASRKRTWRQCLHQARRSWCSWYAPCWRCWRTAFGHGNPSGWRTPSGWCGHGPDRQCATRRSQ